MLFISVNGVWKERTSIGKLAVYCIITKAEGKEGYVVPNKNFSSVLEQCS